MKDGALEDGIGSLRYYCQLATRTTTPGIPTDIITNEAEIWCSIIPLGTQQYIDGINVNWEVTHRIFFRWLPSVDMYNVILRETIMPDDTIRQDIFRIMRQTEWNGINRFWMAECVLEEYQEPGLNTDG